MATRSAESEPPIKALKAPAPGVTGISMAWLFDSPAVKVARWRCQVHETGRTSERHQHWHVIGFAHEGAYTLHAPRGTTLVEASRIAFFNPEEPYETSHPCGCGDHGSSLILRGDLLADIAADTGDRKSVVERV